MDNFQFNTFPRLESLSISVDPTVSDISRLDSLAIRLQAISKPHGLRSLKLIFEWSPTRPVNIKDWCSLDDALQNANLRILKLAFCFRARSLRKIGQDVVEGWMACALPLASARGLLKIEEVSR